MKKLAVTVGLVVALAAGWLLRLHFAGDNQQQDAIVRIKCDQSTSPMTYTLRYKLAKGDSHLRLRGIEGSLRFVLVNFPKNSVVRITSKTAPGADVFLHNVIEVPDDCCGAEFETNFKAPASVHAGVLFDYALKIGTNPSWVGFTPLDPHWTKGGPAVVVDGGN